MASDTLMSGGCLCGVVRFTAVPRNRDVGACHCAMCRRWTAGPFLVVDCGDSFVADNPALLGIYRSSEWAERGFCATCGSALFYRLIDQNLYFVSAEAFDDRDGYVLASQVFIDEKPAYYEFANHTHNMTGAELFAAFAPPAAAQAKE